MSISVKLKQLLRVLLHCKKPEVILHKQALMLLLRDAQDV